MINRGPVYNNNRSKSHVFYKRSQNCFLRRAHDIFFSVTYGVIARNLERQGNSKFKYKDITKR